MIPESWFTLNLKAKRLKAGVCHANMPFLDIFTHVSESVVHPAGFALSLQLAVTSDSKDTNCKTEYISMVGGVTLQTNYPWLTAQWTVEVLWELIRRPFQCLCRALVTGPRRINKEECPWKGEGWGKESKWKDKNRMWWIQKPWKGLIYLGQRLSKSIRAWLSSKDPAAR